MGPDELRDELRKAYRRLLNPLVRILIRNGVTAPELAEVMRQVFVDAATSDEFQLAGRRLSDTRVAILTGLSRKEVHRLRHETGTGMGGTALSRVGRVIAGWNQDPEFTGPYGVPLAIPFETDPSIEAPSFTELARRYSGDMSARAMLDELLRTGLAELDDDRLIRNTGRTYIPTKLDPASVERLGKVVLRLAETLDFNDQAEDTGDRRYERDVVTDIGLTDEQYRQFNIYLRKKCQELLETVDNWLATQEGRIGANRQFDRTAKRKVVTGIGVYHFVDKKLPFEEEQVDGDDPDESI